MLYPAELQAQMCSHAGKMERVMGIEPTWPAWKAGVLPLNYTRMLLRRLKVLLIIAYSGAERKNQYVSGNCLYVFHIWKVLSTCISKDTNVF